jgi:hypothetical protein
VSEALGEGIETWGVAGSSPDIWEEWQLDRPLSSTTIVGVSVYDLNEMHLAPDRARIVGVLTTIHDLWVSGADSDLSHRILAQYELGYMRLLFPTADDAERVLVGVRTHLAEQLGHQASLAEYEGVVVQPSAPLLDAGDSAAKVSDWSPARLLRRVAALRTENRGRHEFFNGPKRLAFHRLLSRGRRQGRVIVVVLPVSGVYTKEFLDEKTRAAFDKSIADAMALVPDATFVRADRIPGISNSNNFVDLVHMNSLGRRIATTAFLTEITNKEPPRRLDPVLTTSLDSGDVK